MGLASAETPVVKVQPRSEGERFPRAVCRSEGGFAGACETRMLGALKSKCAKPLEMYSAAVPDLNS